MTWTADSTWYLQREPGFWRRKRQAYLDLPPWVGLGRDASPTHEAEAREHLLEVLLTFPVGGSRTQRLQRRGGRPTLRDCAEELGVKKPGEHDWPAACPPKGGKPHICAALCALASSGRDGEVAIAEWLRRERIRQEDRECYRQRALHDFVACPDTLTLFVLHGYHPENAAAGVTPAEQEKALQRLGRTAKEVLKLRQVGSVFRAAVDCDVVWRRFYVAISEGKRFQPPAISRLLGLSTHEADANSGVHIARDAGVEPLGAMCSAPGHLPHLAAFQLALVEHGRAALTVDDLCSVMFYSRAKRHCMDSVEQLEAVCPWWRHEEPRRHHFGRDGILRSYRYDPALGSTVFDRQVGPWRFVATPPGFPPGRSYVCTQGRATTVWEVRRTPTWDVIMVSGVGIKCTAPLPSRSDDIGSVGEAYAMTVAHEAALVELSVNVS